MIHFITLLWDRGAFRPLRPIPPFLFQFLFHHLPVRGDFMNPIKIVFFDIDGTLIDMTTKRISQKMLETLRRLKENGTILCIATGRSPMALPHFEGVDFDAFLTFNGSYCFTEDADIFSNPIPTEDVHTIIQNATALGRPLTVATKNRMAANGKDADLIEYYSFAKQEIDVAEDFDQVANEKVYQLMAGSSVPEHAKLMENIKHARITYWWDRAVDIIPADGGKGRGIDKILEYYHLDKSEAMAFGDGNNDIEMLQHVGCGVAMANASDDLKAIADDVCGDVSEDGIYHYCLKHKMI